MWNKHSCKSITHHYVYTADKACIQNKYVTCIFQVKTSRWDTNIRVEAEMEVVRCAVQERGDGRAWKRGERRRATEDHNHIFFHSSTEAWKHRILVIWQQRKQQRPPKPTFSLFFLFVKCSRRREKGITFIWDICFIWNHFSNVGLTYLAWQGKVQSKKKKKTSTALLKRSWHRATVWFCQGPSQWCTLM